MGTLFGVEVVIVKTGVGKANAALSVGLLKGRFDVSGIIMTGIAGGADPDVSIGDIIFPSAFINHDVDSRPNFERFKIPFTEDLTIPVDPKLIKLANETGEAIQKSVLNNPPQFHTGLIASGDQFIADADKLRQLVADIKVATEKETLCVEMEGAAVAQACKEVEIPFMAARIISDCPLQHKSVDDYHEFKKNVAAPYCHILLEHLLPKFSDHLKTLAAENNVTFGCKQ